MPPPFRCCDGHILQNYPAIVEDDLLANVGKVLNQPDESSSFNSIGIGGSSSSTSIRRKNANLLGAVLEGGFTPLIQQINARNQRALAQIQAREDVWYIPAPKDVTVVVNKSFEL